MSAVGRTESNAYLYVMTGLHHTEVIRRVTLGHQEGSFEWRIGGDLEMRKPGNFVMRKGGKISVRIDGRTDANMHSEPITTAITRKRQEKRLLRVQQCPLSGPA
jgi:hypothetical protein